MKYRLTIAAAFCLAASCATAQDNRGIDNGTSLGDVTKDAVSGGGGAGRAHGGHASDPSGDGLGREDRKGLANAVDPHDLSSTVDLIDGD